MHAFNRIFAAAAIAMISTAAMSQDVDAVADTTDNLAPTVEVAEITVPGDVRVTVVCNLSGVVLSEDAQAVCNDPSTAPKLVTDGSRFDNRGIGREFNVLYVNRAAFAD